MFRTLALAGGICLGLFGATAKANDAQAFYQEETTIFVVGYGAGGGYDAYARLLAPELEKRLGGTVVVENRPGAGGSAALNGMFRGKPDPLELHMTNGEGALLSQLTDREGRRFDVSEIQWLGRVAAAPGVILLSEASPFKTIDDLRNADRPIKFSASSKADALSDFVAVFCEVLSIECKIITGYSGSRESSLAAIRGEVDGFAVEASSAFEFARGGELFPIATLARERTDAFPSSPTIFEAANVPDDKAWLVDFRAAISTVGRSISIGPGVEADKVAYLREVVRDVMTNAGVAADASSRGRDIRYLTATEQESIIETLVNSFSKEQLDVIRDVLLTKYF